MTKKTKRKAKNVSGNHRHTDGNKNKKQPKQQQRSAATVRHLKMYKVRPKRDRKGKVISNEFQSKQLPDTRIQPDRRWFGNTRVVSQQEISLLYEELKKKKKKQVSNGYNVILKHKTLPTWLFT